MAISFIALAPVGHHGRYFPFTFSRLSLPVRQIRRLHAGQLIGPFGPGLRLTQTCPQ